LLGLVENLVDKTTEDVNPEKAVETDETVANRKRLIKRMRILVGRLLVVPCCRADIECCRFGQELFSDSSLLYVSEPLSSPS